MERGGIRAEHVAVRRADVPTLTILNRDFGDSVRIAGGVNDFHIAHRVRSSEISEVIREIADERTARVNEGVILAGQVPADQDIAANANEVVLVSRPLILGVRVRLLVLLEVRLVMDSAREADPRENEGRQLAAKCVQCLNQLTAGLATRVRLKPRRGERSEQPPRARRPLGLGDPRRVLPPRVRIVAAPWRLAFRMAGR